jgi:hypothetical protein
MAISDLNKFGENNNVLLRWIPAQKGHGGNEETNALAKRGSGNSNSTQVQLPVPKVIWKGALRERTHRKMRDRWRKPPPSHFKRVWRQKFAKSISKFGKEDLRTATQFLTRHCEPNYHINKYKHQQVSKTCPRCHISEETMNHLSDNVLSGLINEEDILIPFISVLPMLLTNSLYGGSDE